MLIHLAFRGRGFLSKTTNGRSTSVVSATIFELSAYARTVACCAAAPNIDELGRMMPSCVKWCNVASPASNDWDEANV